MQYISPYASSSHRDEHSGGPSHREMVYLLCRMMATAKGSALCLKNHPPTHTPPDTILCMMPYPSLSSLQGSSVRHDAHDTSHTGHLGQLR